MKKTVKVENMESRLDALEKLYHARLSRSPHADTRRDFTMMIAAVRAVRQELSKEQKGEAIHVTDH